MQYKLMREWFFEPMRDLLYKDRIIFEQALLTTILLTPISKRAAGSFQPKLQYNDTKSIRKNVHINHPRKAVIPHREKEDNANNNKTHG